MKILKQQWKEFIKLKKDKNILKEKYNKQWNINPKSVLRVFAKRKIVNIQRKYQIDFFLYSIFFMVRSKNKGVSKWMTVFIFRKYERVSNRIQRNVINRKQSLFQY